MDNDLEMCSDFIDTDILASVTSNMHHSSNVKEKQECTEHPIPLAQIHCHELR